MSRHRGLKCLLSTHGGIQSVSTIVCLCWVLLTSAVVGYLPDERECPGAIDPGLISPEYWVPPGVPHRAWRTLPWKILTIQPSSIPNAGLGVFSNIFIKRDTLLAVYEGDYVSSQRAQYIINDYVYTWHVYGDGEVTHYIDGMDETLSNWLRFLNCPRHVIEENVVTKTCYGQIHYLTKKDIFPGEELLVYYGDSYAKNRLKMDVTKYHLPEYADVLTRRVDRKWI